MTTSTCRRPLAELLDAAIELFLEYRDVHGYPEELARPRVVAEVLEGAAIRCADLGREPCADCRAQAD